MRRLLGMPVARFLREHWQRKPLLVRGALDMRDPFTPEALAGLACEDGVDSRIVREGGGVRPWQVIWGPHPPARFAALPARGWTLLVQECNRHVPAVALVLEQFAFIPNVRVDDVMVSYATPGGSVGPHLDSYDVFLVQGMGQRRWRYAMRPTRAARYVAGLDLRILETFRFDADDVLGPGDLLYLPPGFAHQGVAVTPCLTYSIGFRAPSFGEMWKDFAAHTAGAPQGRGAQLLADPPLVPAANPGAIPPALLARARKAIRAMDGDDDTIDRWFAASATRLAPGHTLEAPQRAPTERTIVARLARGDAVARSEEGRWAFLPRPRGGMLLYVGGEELEVGRAAASLARRLCASRRPELAAHIRIAASRALIVRLFAMGALRFVRRGGGGARRSSRS